MRSSAGLIAAGRDATARAVTTARRRTTNVARDGAERARRLAPLAAFGAARRQRNGHGLSL